MAAFDVLLSPDRVLVGVVVAGAHVAGRLLRRSPIDRVLTVTAQTRWVAAVAIAATILGLGIPAIAPTTYPLGVAGMAVCMAFGSGHLVRRRTAAAVVQTTPKPID